MEKNLPSLLKREHRKLYSRRKLYSCESPLFKNRSELFKDRPGVSLLIAIIFVMIMMVAGAGLAKSTIATWENIRRSEEAGQSLYLTEAAVNEGSYVAAKFDAGFEAKLDTNAGIGRNSAVLNLFEYSSSSKTPLDKLIETVLIDYPQGSFGASWEIKAKSSCALDKFASGPSGTPYYSVPLAYHKDRTGTGGTGYTADVCDIGPGFLPSAKEIVTGTGNVTEKCTDPYNLDDPCHWDKLKFGQTVAIPLYYTKKDGTVINPKDSDAGKILNTFKLRVRTPCVGANEGITECVDDPVMLGSSGFRDRLKAPDPNDDDSKNDVADFQKDPVLITWEITGTDINTGKTVSMIPWQAEWEKNNLRTNKRWVKLTDTSSKDLDKKNQNTELFSSLINNPFILKIDGYINHIVLDFQEQGLAIRGTQGKPEPILSFIKTLDKPIMTLMMVRRLEKNDTAGGTKYMPYLEYQTLTDRVIADSKSIIIGTGYSGKSKRTFEGRRYISIPATGFVLQN